MNKIDQLNLRGNTRVDYYILEYEGKGVDYIIGLNNNNEYEKFYLIGRKTPNKWFEYQGLEVTLDYFDPSDEGVKNVSPSTWEVMFSEQKYL